MGCARPESRVGLPDNRPKRRWIHPVRWQALRQLELAPRLGPSSHLSPSLTLPLLPEFSHWAIIEGLDLDGVPGEDEPPPTELVATKKFKTTYQKPTPITKPPETLDLNSLAAMLPVSKDAEGQAARKKMFSAFDPNGNGYISLAEVDLGLRRTFGEKSAAGHTEVDALAPAIARAFHAAKDSCETGSPHGADFVERKEFQTLLVYLRRYFELFGMFKDLDTSDDGRMSEDEFIAAVPKLARWGVVVRNPAACFLMIDQNGGGFVLFDEFSHWAILKNLESEGTEDGNANGGGGSRRLKAAGSGRVAVNRLKAAGSAQAPQILPKVALSRSGVSTSGTRIRRYREERPDIVIEKPPDMPDTPFEQYLEGMRRFAEALKRAPQ